MSGEIRKLSSEVIDQIAAGEVVERPANLIKELVENAVDAGATSVEVDVDDGGRKVSVIDNGRGMSAEDMPLALDRHATSKIRQAADLWQISSFGFRGEALASIAAVSELSLISRTLDSDSAYKLQSEFGKRQKVEKVGGGQGTTIAISRLFENVPARLKFLKSESGEVGQIKHIFKALGLIHWDIAFRLKVRGKLVFYWPVTNSLMERAEQILEKSNLYQVEGEYEGVKSHIIFSAPQDTFGTSRNIWMFVQNRWVQDRSLQAAVTEAYRGLLMHGEFPFVVASLSCDPQMVDVNIHPTKSQVKFQNQQAAFRAIQRPLREALEKAPWVQTVLQKKSEGEFSGFGRESGAGVSRAIEEFNLKFAEEGFERSQYSQKKMPQYSQRIESPQNDYIPQSDETSFGKRNGVNGGEDSAKPFPWPVRQVLPQEEMSSQNQKPKWGSLQVLAQANNTYIITQNSEKLIFVDQHAAHERIAYEKLMKMWNGGAYEVQQYLIPLSVEMPEHLTEAVMTSQDELARIGVSMELGGPSTVLVRSAPIILKETAIAKTIHRLAEDIFQQGESFAMEKSIADICATMACHSVIRAGQTLSLEEMKALLEGMDEFPLSTFCPHGRPVFVEYPFGRLERDFGRIV